MNRAVVRSGRVHVLANEPQPAIGPNDLLVAVEACSIEDSQQPFGEDGEEGTGSARDLPAGHAISGKVERCGADVKGFEVGDSIIGLLPVDSACSGYADYAALPGFNAVQRPEGAGALASAAAVIGGLRAYTALYSLAHMAPGDTVLIVEGASAHGIMAIQLAKHWGARVLATASNITEALFLRDLDGVADVIDLSNRDTTYLASCLKSTQGLGVDILLDSGTLAGSDRQPEQQQQQSLPEAAGPSKHDIITSLAFGGRWVTSCPDLQIDPPDSRILFAKGASICFLWEQAWLLSGAQQGRFLHALDDLAAKVATGALRPKISKVVSFRELPQVANAGALDVGVAVLKPQT